MARVSQPPVPLLLKRCNRLIDRRIEYLLKRHAIARSQYRVLYLIKHLREPTLKELTDALEIQGATLTPIVDVLVQKGWLSREQDTRDRRIKKLKMTPDGEKLFRRIPDPAETIQETITEHLNQNEIRQFRRLLNKVITSIS